MTKKSRGYGVYELNKFAGKVLVQNAGTKLGAIKKLAYIQKKEKATYGQLIREYKIEQLR